MADSAVSIALLYPELLGTYGDGGNAVVLAQRLRWRGIDVGSQLAHQFLLDVFERVDGVLFVPSFHRYEMVGELVRETVRLRDRQDARLSANRR